MDRQIDPDHAGVRASARGGGGIDELLMRKKIVCISGGREGGEGVVVNRLQQAKHETYRGPCIST